MSMDKVEFETLFNYIAKKGYPANYSKDEKRRLRQKSVSFCVASGHLLHIGTKDKRTRVIVDEEEKKHLMATIHEGIGGCHFGQNATIQKMTNQFWWPGISSSVREFVRNCSSCQKANPSSKPRPVHPIKVSHIFHRWGIDFVGPLKETTRGKKFILVATEYVTKWAEVKSVAQINAHNVHEFLMKLVFRFGTFNVLLRCQGRESNNDVNQLCEQLQMLVEMTSAYHPQTYFELTERFNQTLVTHLMKIVNMDGNDWDDHIEGVAFAYRVSHHGSTKFTPFELMYGVRARLPIDMEEKGETTWPVDNEELKQRVVELTESLPICRDEAKDNMCSSTGETEGMIQHEAC